MTKHYDENKYYNAFKQVRNRIRKYDARDVIINCIARLHAPEANSIQKMRTQPPWRLFLLLKWTLVFGEFAGSVMTAILMSLALGVVFGYTATLLTFGISSIWPILGKVLTYPFFVMFLIVFLESIAMIIACYHPARRAGNTDPADVLRNM